MPRRAPTASQQSAIEAASNWAARDERVRALLLKGSLARGDGDERSDVDLVVVAAAGRGADLWADRRSIAGELGTCLGGFEEAPWHAPHTFIALLDGPVKVDLFFEEGEPAADPWLRDGLVALVDPEGVAAALRVRLGGADVAPDLSDFEAHAWDWLWWMDTKLARSEHWLVHLELVKFFETILLAGHNALAEEPWRGASEAEHRLAPEVRSRLTSAVPSVPEPAELRRAHGAALQAYLELREHLAAEQDMPLASELAAQVLASLER